jgi:sRNA-binding protein
MCNEFLAHASRGIALLAERFPAVFALEGWQPHKPLKIGIKADIAATGIMPAEDIRPALRLYVQRLMYQRALAAGGSRYDLNGEPCGEVTAEQASIAATAAAHIAAVAQTKGATAITVWKAKANKPRKVWKVFPDGYGANKPDKCREPENITAAPAPTPDLTTTSATSADQTPKRLSLADLKKAAQQRRGENNASA